MFLASVLSWSRIFEAGSGTKTLAGNCSLLNFRFDVEKTGLAVSRTVWPTRKLVELVDFMTGRLIAVNIRTKMMDFGLVLMEFYSIAFGQFLSSHKLSQLNKYHLKTSKKYLNA